MQTVVAAPDINMIDFASLELNDKRSRHFVNEVSHVYRTQEGY